MHLYGEVGAPVWGSQCTCLGKLAHLLGKFGTPVWGSSVHPFGEAGAPVWGNSVHLFGEVLCIYTGAAQIT